MRDTYRKVTELRERETRRIIGLMSGTSADGVTAALTRITGAGEQATIKLEGYKTYPYHDEVQQRLFTLFNPKTGTVRDACELNFVIGEAFADSVERILADTGINVSDVDLIGSHGQTIWHQPKTNLVAGHSTRSTLQIGEPAVISFKTGLPVIADFRKADIVAGGEGAPLTPYLDYVLHRDPKANRVLQNIGGIANLTYLPSGGSLDDIVAFDTGPGNMIIDAVVKRYTGGSHDVDGAIARRGEVHPVLLDKLLSHIYFASRAPKTTGREMFGEHYADEIIKQAKKMRVSMEDVVATITALTFESIAQAYETHLPGDVDEIYVSGGGARNPVLMEGLRDRLEAPVYEYSALGFPSEAKEAVLMALLANEHVMGVPCNVPSATGAQSRVVLGCLTWV
ncbi:MAG: anhydro-N-acetylmuramic acid kinase [Candidatus Bathyarchaeota archaeon]|nr:anhydro-N-acetylmuramic acid kinase [Candidatus Bathyarchaeota archaeon]